MNGSGQKMPDDEDDGRFTDDDPSTMVVGNDDARYAEMLAATLKARAPAPTASPAPVTARPPAAKVTPADPAPPVSRVAQVSSAGVIDVPAAKPSGHRTRTALVLGVVAIAAAAVARFALHWW
jgi:hypothetical protein